MATESRTAELEGLPVHWLSAPAHGTPTLWVHGVPNSADTWRRFLERSGGVAVDLPGFGRSGKPAHFPYTLAGYDTFLERFIDEFAQFDRFNLVLHDWGAVALGTAQRLAARIDKLAIIDGVPLLPGYRWHRLARAWQTPVLGELLMGSATARVMRFALREANVTPGSLPEEELTGILEHFDHGTQRAILKLYRSAAPEQLAGAGLELGAITAPALVIWGAEDPYIPASFAQRYADALGGVAEVEVLPDAGHWPWLDRTDVIERVGEFLAR
ncbi:MAG: alpha/beta hydrolase [Solirubrobacteraceae bacterium]